MGIVKDALKAVGGQLQLGSPLGHWCLLVSDLADAGAIAAAGSIPYGGSATPVGTVSSGGSSFFVSRADHVHAHSNQPGGSLHAVATVLTAGFMSATDKVALDALVAGGPFVPTSRTLTAGAGMTGGGDLSADRTFDIVAADGTIVVNANSIQVGVITDANHGNLSGGALHAVATGALAGFMSAADKNTLDSLAVLAVPNTRTLTAGAGMTGGGDLSADRTFDIVAADGTIVVNANSIQVGTVPIDQVSDGSSVGLSYAMHTNNYMA